MEFGTSICNNRKPYKNKIIPFYECATHSGMWPPISFVRVWHTYTNQGRPADAVGLFAEGRKDDTQPAADGSAQLSTVTVCVCVLYRKDAWFSKYVRSKLTPSSLYRVHVWASPPHVEGGQPGSKFVFCLFSDDVVYGCLVPFVPTSEGNTVSTFSHSLSGRPHVAFPFHFFLFVLSSLLWETL